MTVTEARGIITDYYMAESHTEDDKFLFVEAYHFLIDAFHRPYDMHNLAFHYAEERHFDLYQKYLELSAEYGYCPAYESLGYLWYYGQNGTVDYEKAYFYFRKGAECADDYMRISCEYKIADMYRYGYFVEKDEARYRDMIKRLYYEISHPEELDSLIDMEFYPMPGVIFRMAEIKAAEGKNREALKLLGEAKVQIAEDIKGNPSWWGNLEEMESVVMLIHKIPGGSRACGTDLYDLFCLSRDGLGLSFVYNGIRFTAECVREGRSTVIKFNNKWYRDINSFFEKAKIGGRPLTALYGDLIDYEIEAV